MTAIERLTQISGQIAGSKSAKDKILQKNADDVCDPDYPIPSFRSQDRQDREK